MMERLTYRTAKGEAMGNSSIADIGDILRETCRLRGFRGTRLIVAVALSYWNNSI